ncbi:MULTISPECIES: hypothetical protein [unclassified Pseudomonas]|uniref:hypothetical protein n=1 Tax=unclassified Pseudomonas TaxID=196821 RepID=UPI0012F7FFBC|nr:MULTISPECIES: hypothetical protein [unclassified Pseudomonas]MBD9545146.1 hypothetical protein [Pseudomonas sp. PDM01]
MEIDLTHPTKLYRYSERKWLERSLELGEFRLRPASDYKQHEMDPARHDDELFRISKSPASSVCITLKSTGQIIKPIGDVVYRSEVGTNYFTICFSKRWDEHLFDEFPNTDSCLVIHDVKEFSNRFHSAAEGLLPEWIGVDAAIEYGKQSKLGAVFSKPLLFALQHEWRFAWRPSLPIEHLDPITIEIGSIIDIAEIVDRSNHVVSRA